MKPFDLKTIYNAKRPLSWSAISSFKWNKDTWYRKYVLKELPEITPELEFGSYIDKKLQDDPTFLPNVVRYSVLQHEMTGTFNKIPLLGYADTFQPPVSGAKIFLKNDKLEVTDPVHIPCAIRDYKTGRKPWDQKRADETGQLTMYLFMLYLRDKIQPEDVECYIDWLPTRIEEGKIVFRDDPVEVFTFKTSRTMQDVLEFGQLIKDTWDEMQAYGERQASMEMGADEFYGR